jgi:hypothetical protein
MHTNHSRLIDDLGGTGVVAKMFNIEPPSVSYWRANGIPKARLMYLRAVFPSKFDADGSVVLQDQCKNHTF